MSGPVPPQGRVSRRRHERIEPVAAMVRGRMAGAGQRKIAALPRARALVLPVDHTRERRTPAKAPKARLRRPTNAA